MSVRAHRGGWEVRWRDSAGRSRAKRFSSEDAAQAFDDALIEISPAERRSDTTRFGRRGGNLARSPHSRLIRASVTDSAVTAFARGHHDPSAAGLLSAMLWGENVK